MSSGGQKRYTQLQAMWAYRQLRFYKRDAAIPAIFAQQFCSRCVSQASRYIVAWRRSRVALGCRRYSPVPKLCVAASPLPAAMSLSMQAQIRENAMKINETMHDLLSFEEEMDAKDAAVRAGTDPKAAAVAAEPKKQYAVRGGGAAAEPEPEPEPLAPVRGGGPTAAQLRKEAGYSRAGDGAGRAGQGEDWKHGDMKDYYNRWDAFDEDEADVGTYVSESRTVIGGKVKEVAIEGPTREDGLVTLHTDRVAAPASAVATTLDAVAAAAGADESEELEATQRKALGEKEKGNVMFKQQRFGESVAAYTRGVDLMAREARGASRAARGTHAVLLCNRAMAHLRLANWALAEQDGAAAIELDASNPKGFMRRGAARKSAHRYRDAAADFESVLRLEPTSKDAIRELSAALDLLRKFGDRRPKTFKDGLRLAFEPSKKQARPWRVAIPVREADVDSDDEAEATAAPAPAAVAFSPGQIGGGGAGGISSGGGDGAAIPKPRRVGAPAATAEPLALPKPAKSASEFERNFKRLLAEPVLQLEYLQQSVAAEALPHFFRSSLTPELLSGLVSCLLQQRAAAEPGVALGYLQALGRTNRASMAVLSLTADEQAQLGELVTALREAHPGELPDLAVFG